MDGTLLKINFKSQVSEIYYVTTVTLITFPIITFLSTVDKTCRWTRQTILLQCWWFPIRMGVTQGEWPKKEILKTWGFPLLLKKMFYGTFNSQQENLHIALGYFLHFCGISDCEEKKIYSRTWKMDVCNYSDVKEDLVFLLRWAFHARLQNNIHDFAVIKKTSIGKKIFFFFFKLQNVPKKLVYF